MIIDWLMAACCMAWPNKSDIPLHTGLWSSMEDLQNYIHECNGFILSVFHIITSCKARVIELILQFCVLTTFWILGSQNRRTTYLRDFTVREEDKPQEEVTGSHSLSLSRSLPGSVWVCSPAVHLPFKVGFSFSDTLSLI